MEYLGLHRENQEQNRKMFGADYRADLDLIFADPVGNYRKPDSVSWTVCDIAHKAGLENASLHTLRHTHASTLLANGVPVANVSKRLGHGDAHTTAKIYQHPYLIPIRMWPPRGTGSWPKTLRRSFGHKMAQTEMLKTS